MLSRVADSLYWMSRYLERAEHTARIIDVHLNLTFEDTRQRTILERWSRVLDALNIEKAPDDADDYRLTHLLTFDAQNSQSIVSCISAARENARQIREQISSEMWTELNSLYLNVRRRKMVEVWNQGPNAFYTQIKEGSHLFQGITDSTMVRGEGWHFIQLGRFIERALAIVALLDVQFRAARLEPDYSLPLDEYIDWLSFLKSFTAFEAYCKVHTADLRADKIANFLLFNPVFPHSLRFCVEMMNTALESIAAETQVNRQSRLYRLIGRLRSSLSFDEMEDVAGDFHHYLESVNHQFTQIHDGVYDTYIYRPVDAGW